MAGTSFSAIAKQRQCSPEYVRLAALGTKNTYSDALHRLRMDIARILGKELSELWPDLYEATPAA